MSQICLHCHVKHDSALVDGTFSWLSRLWANTNLMFPRWRLTFSLAKQAKGMDDMNHELSNAYAADQHVNGFPLVWTCAMKVEASDKLWSLCSADVSPFVKSLAMRPRIVEAAEACCSHVDLVAVSMCVLLPTGLNASWLRTLSEAVTLDSA